MKTKEEYEKALKEINDAFYGANLLSNQTRRFDNNLNLLRELVNEHFEEKQETNLERYYDDLAMYGKELCKCDEVDCSVCSFNNGRGSCQQSRNKWLNKPYEKPTYQLTQFEFDLLQINSIKAFRFKNINALTLMKEKGYFKDIDEDATIEEIIAKSEVVG